MSQSPADEHGRPARESARTRQGPESRSFFQRTVERARAGIERCVDAVRTLVGVEDRPPDRDNQAPHRTHNPANAANLVVSPTETTLDTRSEPRQRLPERDRLFTRRARDDPGPDPPEPVARVDGERLTVELPDTPGARITSDVWERVEP